MKNENRVYKLYVIGMELLLQAVMLFPWMNLPGHRYNAITYFVKMAVSGDFAKCAKESLLLGADASGYDAQQMSQQVIALVGIVVVSLIAQVFSLLHLLTTFAGKAYQFLNSVALFVMFAIVYLEMMEFPFEGTFSLVYSGIIALLLLLDFMGMRMIDSWAENQEEYERLKKRDQEAKEERKRRLAFPGKYAGEFYQILWKNYLANKKDYLMWALAGSVAIGFVFAGIGMAESMQGLNQEGNIYAGHGIGAILLNFILVSLLISIFLITSVFISYLRKRMNNYGIFANLGMRKRTLNCVMGMEVVACMILVFVGGSILGNVIFHIVRGVLIRGLHMGEQMGQISFVTYLAVLGIVLVIFGLSFVVVHDFFMGTEMAKSRTRAVEKEKMPGKLAPVFFGAGIAIVLGAILRFNRREGAEGNHIVLILIAGLYLIIRYGWSLYLKWRKEHNEKNYYENLLQKNSNYHRYRTALRYVYLLCVIHIAVLFIFSKDLVSSGIAEKPESLFPYDYMCMAWEEDDDIFDALNQEEGVKVTTIPMIRVTNVFNSESWEDHRFVFLPQGQHIGISESTFHELNRPCGREETELNLSDDGSDVYLVYQQDRSVKAHPIDYIFSRTEPYLRIGQPVLRYDFLQREKLFPKRKVVGQEVASLTGAYRRGLNENIVVFSDAYFEKEQERLIKEGFSTTEDGNKTGPITKLQLLNVTDGKRADVEKKLEKFRGRHAYDESIDSDVESYYATKTTITQMKTDRIMTMVIDLFIIGAMTFTGLFVVYLKFESEIEEKKQRREFLRCIGMRKRDRVRILKSEVQTFLWMPLAGAGVIVGILTAIILRLRLYAAADCMRYLTTFAQVAGVYLLIQLMGMKLIEWYVIRKVEGKDEADDTHR